MKSRYLPLIPVVLFSCNLSAEEQLVEKYMPIPVRYAADEQVSILIEKIESQQKHSKVTMRLINPGKVPINYYGYTMNSPTFRQQTMKDGKWVDKPMGFCGTGLSMQTLPAGQSVALIAHISEQDMPGRIGIATQTREGKKVVLNKVVWSPKTPAAGALGKRDMPKPLRCTLRPPAMALVD